MVSDTKTGQDYFRELLSIWPGADIEDYFKNGQWQTELMQIDIELIEAHRKEAGAPEPTPLDEVKMPALPRPAGVAGLPGVGGKGAACPPAGVAGLAANLGKAPAVKPYQPGSVTPGVRPAIAKPGAVPRVGAGSPVFKTPLALAAQARGAAAQKTGGTTPASTNGVAATGPSAELRQIALFIQKWKLEATKAKLNLARLTPQRRRWVMANFQGGSTLDEFIQESESTNAWAGAGAATTGSTAGAVAKGAVPRPATSVTKRPLSAIAGGAAGGDPSKRLRPTGPRPAGSIAASGGPKPPSGPPSSSMYPRTGIRPNGSVGAGAHRPVAKPVSNVRPLASKVGGVRPQSSIRPAAGGGSYRPSGPAAAAHRPGGIRPGGGLTPRPAGGPRPAGSVGYPTPAGSVASVSGGKGGLRPAGSVARAGKGGYSPAGGYKDSGARPAGSLIKSLLKRA